MTINALGGNPPRFPSTLRYSIAEMVTRRPEKSQEIEDKNELGALLPFIHYVDDGLSLFKQSITVFENLRAVLLESRNLYQLVLSNQSPSYQEKEAVLQVATLTLNSLRTSFVDQLCNNSPLIQERLNAIRTLSQDLPELIAATRNLGSSYAHPAIDQSEEVLTQVKEQLSTLTGNFYHRQFYRHCLQFPRQKEFASLLPVDENELIPTMTSEYCWPVSFYSLDVLSNLNNAIDQFLVEGTRDNLEQCLSLSTLTSRPADIRKKQREEFPKILQAWTGVVEQVRLLVHITDVLIPVLDAAVNVIWLRLAEKLETSRDNALDAIVVAKITPLLDRVRKYE